MPHAFTLSAIVPEPLTLTDPVTGKTYAVRTMDMLGAKDIARLQRLQKAAFPDGTTDITSILDDEQAAERLDAALADLMGMLVPDLPRGRVIEISIAQRVRFFTWWTDENDLKTPAPEASETPEVSEAQEAPGEATASQ